MFHAIYSLLLLFFWFFNSPRRCGLLFFSILSCFLPSFHLTFFTLLLSFFHSCFAPKPYCFSSKSLCFFVYFITCCRCSSMLSISYPVFHCCRSIPISLPYFLLNFLLYFRFLSTYISISLILL